MIPIEIEEDVKNLELMLGCSSFGGNPDYTREGY